jgi:hypothetical protein
MHIQSPRNSQSKNKASSFLINSLATLRSRMATPSDSQSSKNEKGIKQGLEQPGASITTNDSIDAEKLDPEYGSGQDHIFANEQVADYWRDVYEKAKYEGRHRFDPTFTWSAEEEKRVRKKV